MFLELLKKNARQVAAVALGLLVMFVIIMIFGLGPIVLSMLILGKLFGEVGAVMGFFVGVAFAFIFCNTAIEWMDSIT